MISSSFPGRIVGISSTTVTFAPSLRHTEPSSSPITPPPITIRCFGTSGIVKAPMFDSTRLSSTLRKGSSIGTDPVAMMTFFALYDSDSPSDSATSTTFPFLRVPRPRAQVILFFLNRYSIPFVF